MDKDRSLVFSGIDAFDIVKELMVKYGIDETPKEVMDKLRRGDTPSGRKVANLIRYCAFGRVIVVDLAFEIQKRLKLSKTKA